MKIGEMALSLFFMIAGALLLGHFVITGFGDMSNAFGLPVGLVMFVFGIFNLPNALSKK